MQHPHHTHTDRLSTPDPIDPNPNPNPNPDPDPDSNPDPDPIAPPNPVDPVDPIAPPSPIDPTAPIHTVGIIGLGYVGQPLLELFTRANITTLGYDIDPARVAEILSRGFNATTDSAPLAHCDALIICVPTPLKPSHQPDMRHVESASRTITNILQPNQLIILESTTYPGTTRTLVKPILDHHTHTPHTPYHLAYSPERIDPGRDIDLSTIPKIVGGIDDASTDLAVALYQRVFEKIVPVASCEIAEAAKILENVYRAVNIALVNELKITLTAMDIDIWQVIDAAATKPYGFSPFYPGPGLGGHCIPIDPFYLAWIAKQHHTPADFIELAGRVNHAMPDYVISRIRTAIAPHHHLHEIPSEISPSVSPPIRTHRTDNNPPRDLHHKRILVLGVAYKPNVPDTRQSPSLVLIEKLDAHGAIVDYHDPYVPQFANRNTIAWHPDQLPNLLSSYHAVLIATAHSSYDWQTIAQHARCIIDTRGVMRHIPSPNATIISA